MRNLQGKSRTIPVCGFQWAFYGHEQSVVFTSDKFVKYTCLVDDRPIVKNHYVGLISSACISPDHSVLLVAVEDEGNAKVVALNTTTFDENFSLSVRSLVQALAISSGSEVFAALSSADDKVHISTFNLSTGESDCSGTILTDLKASIWEMSFCPADEGVLCVLGDNNAFLMRCSGGKVENFSNIKFTNVLCHHWSNDVTMCFGTTQGELLLYRETIALEVIDLKSLNENVTESFNDVLYIISTNAWFGILFPHGMIVVFENTSTGPDWSSSKIIVMPQYDPTCTPALSFDNSGNFMLYTDGSLLMECSLKYTETVSKSSANGIAARHSGTIAQSYPTEHYVISIDGHGNIIVTSRKTWRHIVEDKIEDLLLFSMISPEIALIIRKNCIETRLLTIDGFVQKEISPQENILKLSRISSHFYCIQACSSADWSHIAILKDNFLMIFKTKDSSIVVEEKMKMKREVRKMVFSTDTKYLIILTLKQEVFALDIATGKTIWTMDYKLKSFKDMTTYNGVIYLLDEKFIVTRIKHGKELSQLNMHAADISFTCSSTLLTGNDKMLICTTDDGEIIGLNFKQPDLPYILRHSVGSEISYLFLNEEHLSVGYANGSIVLIELERVEQEVEDYFDFTLCDHVTYTNLKTIIKDLDYERNAIREESEAIIVEYKREKEEEIGKMREEYTNTTRSLHAKVKALEENYIQSEEEKKRTITQLQQLYRDEEKGTLEKFERMMDEQIKKIIKMEEQLEKKDRIHQQEIEEITAKLRESFRKTEETMQGEVVSLQGEITRLNTLLQQKQKAVSKAENERERAIVEFKLKMDDFYKKRQEDTNLLEEEIWNLKAAAVLLTEEKDKCANDTSTAQRNLDTSRQQIASLFKSLGELQKSNDQLKLILLENEKRDVDERKKLTKLQQKLIATEKDLGEVQKKAHKYTRRCGELEARISRIGECVYDSKKLQHAVLGLMAFIQNIDTEERFKLT